VTDEAATVKDKCPHCGEEVLLARNPKGDIVMLDPRPGRDGSWYVRREADGSLHMEQVPVGEYPTNAFVGHLLVCANYDPKAVVSNG
jgi:hypothetical protein